MNFITFIGDFMKAKKIIIRSLIVVIVIIIGLYIFGVATGNNVPKEEPNQEEKEAKEDTQKEEEKDQFNPNDIIVADYADKTTDEYINAFIDGVDSKSKIVDVLNRAARNSANYSASEEKRNEAVSYLKDNYPNYTVDDNTMIKVMYYGFYLNHAYGDGTTYGDLGFDASQIAKNIYRGSETTGSDFIKANYEQVEKSLSQIQ